MGFYKVEILRSADHDIRKIDKKYLNHIVKKIRLLEKNPFPNKCKKLKVSESSYRIRIGDYRYSP